MLASFSIVTRTVIGSHIAFKVFKSKTINVRRRLVGVLRARTLVLVIVAVIGQ